MSKHPVGRACLCLGLLAPAIPAQNPLGKLEFDVASIKPAPPIAALAAQMQAGKMHVGMTVDGARVDIGFLSLADLIPIAYRVKPYQVSGPDWMRQERFDIQATIPEGVSKDKVPEMLQALLIDRFKLTIHRETKDLPVYALIVGKNGPKMKESPPDDSPTPETNAAAAATPLAPPPPPPPGGAPGPGRGAFSVTTPNGQMSVQQNGRGAVITGGP